MSPTAQETAAKPHKWRRVLRLFADGARLNRFDALRQAHDHCLHSTVSGLERRGVKFVRLDETIQGIFGPVYCVRYWIAPESVDLARKLLDGISAEAAHA